MYVQYINWDYTVMRVDDNSHDTIHNTFDSFGNSRALLTEMHLFCTISIKYSDKHLFQEEICHQIYS